MKIAQVVAIFLYLNFEVNFPWHGSRLKSRWFTMISPFPQSSSSKGNNGRHFSDSTLAMIELEPISVTTELSPFLVLFTLSNHLENPSSKHHISYVFVMFHCILLLILKNFIASWQSSSAMLCKISLSAWTL